MVQIFLWTLPQAKLEYSIFSCIHNSKLYSNLFIGPQMNAVVIQQSEYKHG